MGDGQRGSQRSSGFGLSEDQKAAVEELSKTNVYEKQSKFKTLRELPAKDRWLYFRQNFLLQTVTITAIVAVVVAFAVSFLTKGSDPELAVEGINMSQYSDSFDSLGTAFAKKEKLTGKNPIKIDTGISLSSQMGQDDSMQLLAMVTAGDVNMIITNAETFADLHSRDVVAKPADVMGASQLEGIKDALVDAKGKPVTDISKAYGFDLSKSKVWKNTKGLPQKDAILGFSNIKKTKNMAVKFVKYLEFE